MKQNDIYKIKVIDEDNNGNGITRIDNMVVFIKNALKDEELEIKIIEINKHYATAKIENIITKSKDRIEIICPFNDKCGGCSFLHTTYEKEKELKHKYLENLFNTNINYLETKNIYNYRNKVTLHVLNGILGMYNDKTHNICKINHCKLLSPKINEIIHDLKNYNLNNIKEIMIRDINNKTMINIQTIKEDKEILNINADSLYINDKYIKGDKTLIDNINNIKYSISPKSFYQINKEGMINIYDKAKEYISKGNKLLDLYCGTGTIGIYLKDNFNEIIGCEINESSIKDANENKKLNNLKNIEFILNDAKNIKGNFDSIVVDPPRSGLSKNVIKFLDNSNASKIVYISCNPKTLKRDIDLLNNYELKEISCADMFPRTKHIECVCLLEKK